MLRVNFRYTGDLVVLDMEGDINVDAANFVEAVGWSLSRGYKKILCNFEAINIVDYVGVSLIAVAYKNVINHNAAMRACNIPAHIVRLFVAVGLDQIFDSYVSEEEAIKGFQDDRRIARVLAKKFRRRFKRVKIPGTIEYQSKGAFNTALYTGKVLNISAVGVFMEGAHLFPVGEILTTRLDFEKFSINVDMRVIWIADGAIQYFSGQAMGLEFYHIDAESQTKIIDFVERHIIHSK